MGLPSDAALAGGGVGYSYEHLTEAERRLIWRHPFAAWQARSLAKIAASEARARFPELLQQDGPGDAFRHAYWTALMARAFGRELAKEFSDAHETGARDNSPAQKRMDLRNNAVGLDIGDRYRSVTGSGRANVVGTPADVARDVMTAYASGELTWLWPQDG